MNIGHEGESENMKLVKRRLTADPELFEGRPIIRGTHLTVKHILQLLATGNSAERVMDDLRLAYPDLDADDLRACLALAAEALDFRPEAFRSRSVGLDVTPGCFVCGEHRMSPTGERYSHDHNIAAFVYSKPAGERVVAMFDEHSPRLDYRDFEPHWIQVKVGACEKHLKNLQRLDRLTTVRGGVIDPFIILAARTLEIS